MTIVRTMFRCCSAAFHAIYSILRNGLWDDPAEAVTGAVYKEFSKQVEAKGIHPNAAVYLTWRYCYLKCFILIGVVWAVSSWSSWLPDRAFLDNFVRNLPEEIQANRFETFIVVMSWWDPALMLVWLSSFLVVLCSIFFGCSFQSAEIQEQSFVTVFGLGSVALELRTSFCSAAALSHPIHD